MNSRSIVDSGHLLSLPHDLSPWGMFLSADAVVQAVIIGLVFASLASWSIGLAKAIELRQARRRVIALRARLAQVRGLVEAERGGAATEDALVAAALRELRVSAGMPAAGIKERMAVQLERLEVAAARRMGFGIGVLATIGATAPFVGLFGTVWGIMNSFVGIARAQTTNLAVVAPGIAEALLATALGLVAAIPAVVIYNALARGIAGYRARLADVTTDIGNLVSRELDRGASLIVKAAE